MNWAHHVMNLKTTRIIVALCAAMLAPACAPIAAYKISQPGYHPVNGAASVAEARQALARDPERALGDYLEPRFGVYVVKAAIDDGGTPRWIGGVANLGRRPTVGGTRVQLEVNLFDFQGDLYGKHLRVAFLGFVRPEMKFAGLDQLKAQIAADSATARQVLIDYAGPQPGQQPADVLITEMPATGAAR